MSLTSKDGRNFVLRSSGSIQSYESSTGQAQFFANGRLSEMRTRDVYVNNGLGEHRMVGRLAAGGNVVKLGASRAYVERPVAAQGRQTIVRTDLVYGRSTTVVYYPFAYGRYQLLFYDPYILYDPGLYAWLDVGWDSPVYYTWGSPWNLVPSGYGRYYTPASTYMMPTAWMADYVLTSNLNEAYAAPDAGAAGTGAMPLPGPADADDGLPVLAAAVDAPITPAIRDQVIEQVSKQVDADGQEAKLQASAAAAQAPAAAQMVPAIIDPAVRVFIVHSTLSVVSGTHQCQLTQGDILLHPQPLADNGTAELLVESSPKGDCPANAVVKVSARDLQEMSNYFKQSITSGEQILASHEGGKLPAPPDAKPIRTLDVPKGDPKSDAALVDQLRAHAAEEEASLQQEIASGATVPK